MFKTKEEMQTLIDIIIPDYLKFFGFIVIPGLDKIVFTALGKIYDFLLLFNTILSVVKI